MGKLSKYNPGTGIADFWSEFRRPNKWRWPILGAAALMTFGLLYTLIPGTTYGDPVRPQVTYITTLAPDRSDAEIRARNLAHQQEKERLAAEQAKRDEEVRNLYRTLGRMSGMDVERIEREAAAERARAEAAAAAAAAAAQSGGADRN